MKLFGTPVVVEPGRLGRFRLVRGPADAIEVMTGRWPEKTSHHYLRALNICREASLGADFQLARHCVVAAANEAKVLVDAAISRQYTVGTVDLSIINGSVAARCKAGSAFLRRGVAIRPCALFRTPAASSRLH